MALGKTNGPFTKYQITKYQITLILVNQSNLYFRHLSPYNR